MLYVTVALPRSPIYIYLKTMYTTIQPIVAHPCSKVLQAFHKGEAYDICINSRLRITNQMLKREFLGTEIMYSHTTYKSSVDRKDSAILCELEYNCALRIYVDVLWTCGFAMYIEAPSVL